MSSKRDPKRRQPRTAKSPPTPTARSSQASPPTSSQASPPTSSQPSAAPSAQASPPISSQSSAAPSAQASPPTSSQTSPAPSTQAPSPTASQPASSQGAAPPARTSGRRTLQIAALAAAAIALALVAFLALRRGSPAPTATPPTGAAPTARTTPTAPAASPTPARPTAAASTPAASNTYVGAARCADCHEKEHARWQASWHARALSPAKRPYLVGDFNNAHFAGASSEAWMKRAGDHPTMRTRDAVGALASFPVDWVIGGKHMQDNLTVLPDGRWQVLPVYYHVTGHAWVDYTEAKQGALTPEHPFYWTNVRRMANHECLDCHTTGLRVAYDEPTHRWSTTFSDPNVACEDCHGRGGHHAASTEPHDIVHPVRAGAAGLAACARCHGPRKPLFPLLDPQHQFELGQSYDELYDPIVVVQDTGVSPEFFVDGRPKTSSFEYQAMLQAACYRKGAATCLTCHTAPHDAAQGHSELRGGDPDASCRKCHADVAAAGRAHTRHTAAAAQRCVSCHMPPTVSGVLDHFADHAIDVPSPENTVRHGVPSACGVCHADRPAAQLATQLAAWWPSARVRQARRLRLADAFDPATARQSARPLAEVVADGTEAPTLRGAAAILLGRRFGPAVGRVLVPLLASADLVLRAKGCEALAAARATPAADPIARLLGDPSLRVRLAAALALYDLRDPRGEPALRRLAEAGASAALLVPHFELGRLAANRGDFATARGELTRVARMSPYFTEGLVELAAVTAAAGDLTEAHARVDQALQLEPHHARARDLRARIEAAMARPAPSPAPP